jgi:carboxyl-terminal processing protease
MVEIKSYDASGKGVYQSLPLVVLANQYTASAAEIVAACLEDHGRAKVVGQRTWGKGSVQTVIPLEGGRSGLKLTIASFWRPNEQNIHRRRNATDKDTWGVMPSPGYEVKLTDTELVDVMQRRRDRDIVLPPGVKTADPQVAKPAEKLEEQAETAKPRQQAARELPVAAEKDEKSAGDPQLERAVEAIQAEIAAASGA